MECDVPEHYLRVPVAADCLNRIPSPLVGEGLTMMRLSSYG